METRLEREEIADPARLDELGGAWRELWRRDPHATPFQHPAWLLPWWRHLGEGELRALALWNRGTLAGLLLLYRRDEPGGARWRFVGVATSDYLGGVFDPRRGEAPREALAWIGDSLPRGETCECAQLPAGTGLARAAAPSGLAEIRRAGEPTHVIALDPIAAGAPEAPLTAKLRHNLGTARRRAERAGPLRLRSSQCGGASDLFEHLVRLHAVAWARRGDAGVLRDPRVLAAHREGLTMLHHDGAAALYALEVGERLVAVVYTLRDAGTTRPPHVYSYLGGFDPEAAGWSPGALILREVIRDAAAGGAARFDFLRGGETYKARFGARPVPTVTRIFERAR